MKIKVRKGANFVAQRAPAGNARANRYWPSRKRLIGRGKLAGRKARRTAK